MCCLGYYCNQLSRKQYEEYFKRLNKYYLYKKKYYERSRNTVAKEETSKENKYKPVKKISKKLYSNKLCNTTHKNQDDKCKVKICETTTSSETLPIEELYKEIKDKSVKKIYKENYDDKLCNTTHKDQEDKCKIEICKTKVSSETLPICENSPYTSDITAGPVTVKIPVVLTECSITITVESLLKLEDAVVEIKHIRKNSYLNQCKLIPNSENDKPNTGILFLAGFIRKNIEYIIKEHNNKGVLNGKLKHVTVDVPFKCTTRVTLNTPPKFKTNNPQEEVEILQTSIGECNPCNEEIIGRNIREQSFRLNEFFNEKVFCELISAEFIESDILENPTDKECKSNHEKTFHDIREKVVLFLTIKLLQNQNVIIPK
jgi:hypothetical protein